MNEIDLDTDYYSDHREIYSWCEQHFGAERGDWQVRMLFGRQYYTFRNQCDAVLFSLKWLSK